MHKSSLLLISLGLAALCLFVYPKATSADPSDVVTVNFTGAANCGSLGSVCGGHSTFSVTGQFDFDPDTNSFGGCVFWSMTALGGFGSCSLGGCSSLLQCRMFIAPGGFPVFDFTSPGFLFIQLIFRPGETQGIGPLDLGVTLSSGLGSDVCKLSSTNAMTCFPFVSGYGFTTPEPPSLFLLGTGLLGLGPLLRRFS